MKIKQLFTSFLACMALWSAPVYANTEEDVRKKYKELSKNAPIKKGLKELYKTAPISPLVDNIYVEVDKKTILKNDMDKKEDILEKSKDYQKALEAFNDAFQKYLDELKPLIDNADKETNRARKRKARDKAREKMYDLICKKRRTVCYDQVFQSNCGITRSFVTSISKKIQKKDIEKDVTKMKDRYNNEITNAKNRHINQANQMSEKIKTNQAAYDAAKAAYDAALKAES